MSRISKVKNKIARLFREKTATLQYALFNTIPSRITQERGLRVLVYHGISKNEPYKFNARFLSEAQFEAHLIALKKCYNPVSLHDVRLGNLSLLKLNVLVTFDDGLKNNYTRALPLLLKHNIPAVFFVSALPNRTDFLFNDVLDVFSLIGPAHTTLNGIHFEKKKRWLNYRYVSDKGLLMSDCFHSLAPKEREKITEQIYSCVPKEKFSEYSAYLAIMSNDELKNLSEKPGMVIGSHGITHADLTKLTKEELIKEVQISKQEIAEITQTPCDAIAFPYGNYNNYVMAACNVAGYTDLFGTEKINDPADRQFIKERFTVNPYISAINQMYYIAKGSYD